MDIEEIRTYYESLASITTGVVRFGYERRLEALESAPAMKMVDFFGKDIYKRVKGVIRPKRHQCYRNAVLAAKLLKMMGYNAEYCEGALICSIPIEHGFICVDGHYFDPTSEMVLKDMGELIVFRKWGADEAYQKMGDNSCYGDLYGQYIIEKYAKTKMK